MKDDITIGKLKKQKRWVCWKTELNDDGKPYRAFYHPATGERAQDTDKRTWANYKTAASAVDAGQFMGLGVALYETTITGLELCNGLKDGQPTPTAEKLLRELKDTYVEVSPDGNGLCFLVQSNFTFNRTVANKRMYGAGFLPLSMAPYKDEKPIRDAGFSFASIVRQLNEESNPFKKKRIFPVPKDYLESGKFAEKVGFFRRFSERRTGFKNMDVNDCLYPGLYVVGAVSSLGKTTWCPQMADQLSADGRTVFYFSYEQSEFEVISKGIAREHARIMFQQNVKNLIGCPSAVDIRKEGIEAPKYAEAVREYKEKTKNLHIVQCSFSKTVEELEQDLLSYMAQHPDDEPPIVFIDYLQIVASKEGATGTRQQIDNVVRKLKQLTKDPERALTVIVISSFNRSSYTDKLSFGSFKESGGIEYTADVVWGMQFAEVEDAPRGSKSQKHAPKQTIEEIASDAKKMNPRHIKLVTLKNRYGSLENDFYFDYYPHCDFFTEGFPPPPPEDEDEDDGYDEDE